MAKISFILDDQTAQALRELVVKKTGSMRKQSAFLASLVQAELER